MLPYLNQILSHLYWTVCVGGFPGQEPLVEAEQHVGFPAMGRYQCQPTHMQRRGGACPVLGHQAGSVEGWKLEAGDFNTYHSDSLSLEQMVEFSL